ncbi:MAG: hypothetical protein HKO66_12815 [Saprospiraceae bacterium]|nr:hypothetical protein [Bacteroidia bacterium]NNE15257.1 hypothetical protein [Saprospiraceae bacterium]NNL93113.1 hypothetical protein [Saprospiraceae bacterium]
MSVLDSARLIVYRCHQKGLEILLIPNDMDNDPDIWQLPDLNVHQAPNQNYIELEGSTDDQGKNVSNIAIEADWHDIPSIRGIIKHDVKLVKSKIKSIVPGIEKGTYFTIKDAFKKVLPREYQALKELKDIILDRNQILNV